MTDSRKDVSLPVGTKVRFDSSNETGANPSEYGVVIHCWRDEELQIWDCLIAFFGSGFPDGLPEEKPYILRYASMQLLVLN